MWVNNRNDSRGSDFYERSWDVASSSGRFASNAFVREPNASHFSEEQFMPSAPRRLESFSVGSASGRMHERESDPHGFPNHRSASDVVRGDCQSLNMDRIPVAPTVHDYRQDERFGDYGQNIKDAVSQRHCDLNRPNPPAPKARHPNSFSASASSCYEDYCHDAKYDDCVRNIEYYDRLQNAANEDFKGNAGYEDYQQMVSFDESPSHEFYLRTVRYDDYQQTPTQCGPPDARIDVSNGFGKSFPMSLDIPEPQAEMEPTFHQGEKETVNPYIPTIAALRFNTKKLVQRLMIEVKKKGSMTFVATIFQRLRNVNVRDAFGWTPVMWAAKTGSLSGLQFLSTFGADFSLSEFGRNRLTAFEVALIHDKFLFLEKLSGLSREVLNEIILREPRAWCLLRFVNQVNTLLPPWSLFARKHLFKLVASPVRGQRECPGEFMMATCPYQNAESLEAVWRAHEEQQSREEAAREENRRKFLPSERKNDKKKKNMARKRKKRALRDVSSLNKVERDWKIDDNDGVLSFEDRESLPAGESQPAAESQPAGESQRPKAARRHKIRNTKLHLRAQQHKKLISWFKLDRKRKKEN